MKGNHQESKDRNSASGKTETEARTLQVSACRRQGDRLNVEGPAERGWKQSFALCLNQSWGGRGEGLPCLRTVSPKGKTQGLGTEVASGYSKFHLLSTQA